MFGREAEVRQMHLHEKYAGIEFTIKENGDGTSSWELQPRAGLMLPRNGTGTVQGGQNEAILAARKAISIYLEQRP
jgi:hypothetical protein